MQQQNWLDVQNIDRSKVNDQWNELMRIFKYHFDQYFPKTVVYNSQRKRNLYKESSILECKCDLDILLVLSSKNLRYKTLYNNQKRDMINC